MKLNPRETATVLAALRYWQRVGLYDRASLAEDMIATNDNTFPALNEEEIDALCERINTGNTPKPIARRTMADQLLADLEEPIEEEDEEEDE